MDAPLPQPAGGDFFSRLPVLSHTAQTFDTARYVAAPDDAWLVVTDIVDSTRAVAAGAHKTVNFVAAMAIAGLKNLCAPTLLPFLFGGDGSVVLVPDSQAAAARRVLARVRGLAQREFDQRLRLSMVQVRELRARGADLRVGRYEPSAGNSFGVFDGGGIAMLEAAMKGRGDAALRKLSGVDEALDDAQPLDLSGLSCRWNELASRNGKMLTLIVQDALRPAEVHARVMALAGQRGNPSPTRVDGLLPAWPPQGFMLEARARRGAGWLAISVFEVLLRTLIARLVFAIGRPVGGFDPQRYVEQVATNTDFCKHDATLSFVVDCAEQGIAPIRAYLEACSARGELRYGMGLSDTALMTCLVTSAGEGLHVHFVDGGDGGYTLAAQGLRAPGGRAEAGSA